MYALFDGRGRVLDAFESKISPIKTKGTCFLNFVQSKLKILSPIQMFWRVTIALTKVKAGNN